MSRQRETAKVLITVALFFISAVAFGAGMAWLVGRLFIQAMPLIQ